MAWIMKLWNVEVFVLGSLAFQIILATVGNKRKYKSGLGIRFIIWFAYSMADWTATIALGKLSQIATQENSSNIYPNDVLKALWAAVLLLHLGGPDTITAYASQDADLWYRHLLGLLVHLAMVIYILVNCSTGYWVSIVLLLSGIIKYGERTWALSYRNNENTKTSMISYNDRHFLSFQTQMEEATFIMKSYDMFQCYKHYIADYVSTITEYEISIIQEYSGDSKKLFELMEFELEFMYDVLYTKIPIICTRTGAIFRALSFIFTVTGLVGFSIAPKDHYANVDVVSTYLLLVGAVFLEVYAVTLLIYSNWGILWMIKHCENGIVGQVLPSLAKKSVDHWKRWSNSVAQFDLLEFCFYEEDLSRGRTTMRSRLLNLFSRAKLFQNINKYQCLKYENNLSEFRRMMLQELQATIGQLDSTLSGTPSFWQTIQRLRSTEWPNKLSLVPDFLKTKIDVLATTGREIGKLVLKIAANFTMKGDVALQRYDCESDLRSSINKDFDESIIIWHIATYICYYDAGILIPDPDDQSRKETSKLVSEYMMYLLVFYPNLIRVRAANFIFDQICSELTDIIHVEADNGPETSQSRQDRLCNTLLNGKYDDWLPSKPTLKDSIDLASILKAKYPTKVWKIINGVWMEKLMYAANQCQVDHHAQLLRKGGELLTLVWVLICHSSLSEKRNKMQQQLDQYLEHGQH
ncbi:hypothetical protein F0562_007141 [Nyssa sinensis]|uniref:DUF4220 domain-containing protein n=1 Tax=Nyssa sinensis TaxID=561372 RepID=A0A5J5A5L7_9ASTE|nr:hypothetical protein F0562_007141 [Nyssa sinensis]